MTDPQTVAERPQLLAPAPFPLHSAAFGKLAGALAKARAAFLPVLKNREVTVKSDKGSYKFKYAELSDIYAATDAALSANGLSHSSAIEPKPDGIYLVTTLMHESDQWLRSYMPLARTNGKPQEFGSQLTYFRRYAISALLGVSSEEDDDGNAAQGNEVTETVRKPANPLAVFNGEPQLLTFQTAVRRDFTQAQSVADLAALAKRDREVVERMFNSPEPKEVAAAKALAADYNDRLQQLQAKPAPAKTVEDVLGEDSVPY